MHAHACSIAEHSLSTGRENSLFAVYVLLWPVDTMTKMRSSTMKKGSPPKWNAVKKGKVKKQSKQAGKGAKSHVETWEKAPNAASQHHRGKSTTFHSTIFSFCLSLSLCLMLSLPHNFSLWLRLTSIHWHPVKLLHLHQCKLCCAILPLLVRSQKVTHQRRDTFQK